jgi:hypothetical protein
LPLPCHNKGTKKKPKITSKRIFLKTAAGSLAASALPMAFLTRSGKPTPTNIILIMRDAQEYGDFGFTVNPAIATPNLDRLVANSVQMDNFYIHPVRAPTRACLLTGRYNYRCRVTDTWVGRAMMEPEETTAAEILKKNGYATGIFGKWHLGDAYPMRPQDQGFDEVLVHRGGGIGQPADPIGAEGQYTDPVSSMPGAGLTLCIRRDRSLRTFPPTPPTVPFMMSLRTCTRNIKLKTWAMAGFRKWRVMHCRKKPIPTVAPVSSP